MQMTCLGRFGLSEVKVVTHVTHGDHACCVCMATTSVTIFGMQPSGKSYSVNENTGTSRTDLL